MDFLILGPLDVRTPSGSAPLGGIKPKAVLAVLLLHANEPVSAERLALAVWGEDAPGGAVANVHTNVSRLRKALGDPDAIATTAAGYCLRVRPGELDAERFEGLVEDARRALADARPADAAQTLRESQDLWRGPALAEFAHEPFATSEIDRLEEQRLAAIELRVDADLAAGRHAEVVGELQRLVAEHPTREGLAGQLMLALYRCGRQAEALEVFGATRKVLVDELGVEPGPRLRELHEAILRQDVTLEAQPATSQLPPALDPTNDGPIAGREAELHWLDDRWARAAGGAGTVVAVTGEAGIGKSRLVAELAHAVHADGAAVLHATGDGPADTVLLALRRARESTRPTLLVVDDADRAGAGVQRELERAARRVAGSPVLVVVCALQAPPLAVVTGDDTLALGALDAQAVSEIAVRYVPAGRAAEVPAGRLAHDSEGVPRRVHEVAGTWARNEAARRVGSVAGRAQAGREELRSIQDELSGGVEELRAADERLARCARDDTPIVCPYKGLASFDVADAPYFFGREKLVSSLVAQLVGTSLLGVVGSSGSGKSSVLRAGLLPNLAMGMLPGSATWQQVLIRPGEHPLRELAAGLATVGDAARVVIAVDQFEETFTTCEDEGERAAFIAELGAAAADADGRFLVLMALRADFYGRCADYPELARPLAANHVLVPSMRRDELRRAIELPAVRAGLVVDPELTDALVADVRDEPGALPLLQTALLELWTHRDGRRLRYGVYEQSGGVRGAVARLAEDAFGQLSEDGQQLVRGVLLRLAGEGEAGGVERRRVPLAELETDSSQALAQAVALLTDRRLLTASEGSIELAHEALLREWPRLRDWIAEDREGMRIHRSIGAAAREWQSLERDAGALYRGTRLTESLDWAAADPQALNAVEREFLADSEAARDHERATRRRRVVVALGGLSFLLVGLVVVAIIAVAQSRDAERKRDAAASGELAARSASLLDSDPRLGLAVSLAALGRSDTEQARSAVRQATVADRTVRTRSLGRGAQFAYSIVPSPDGKRLLTASEGGPVGIWDAASGRSLSTIKGHVDAVGADFSPDGTRVASVGYEGQVAISGADGADRHILLRLAGGPDGEYPRSVEFSPDGKRLLIATSSGRVGTLAAGERVVPLRELGSHQGRAKASFGPTGTHAVSVSDDGTAAVWRLADNRRIALRHPAGVKGADFDPSGTRVATAADDGRVRIFDVATGRLVRTIAVADAQLGSVRYSADGRRIVTGGADGVIRVSSVAGGPALNELRGAGPANDATFVPGTDLVASVGEDGSLRTWSLLAVDQLLAGAPYKQPAFSPDGRHVAGGYADGDVRLWDVATGRSTRVASQTGAPTEVRYSGDGKLVVSASLDGMVHVIDVATGRSRLVPSDANQKFAVAIDGRGERVAFAPEGASPVVQRPDGRQPIKLKGHKGDVLALAFSRDGRRVVSAGDDGAIRVFRVADGRLVGSPLQAGGTVRDVAFSRDGTRIAAAGDDGTARIWPAAGGAPAVLYGHAGAVNSVAFNRAGDRLVTAGKDGTVRVWDTRGGASLVTVQTYGGDATGAAFDPEGKRVLSAGERERVLRISTCELCGSFQSVLRLARARPVRTLDSAERARLLSSRG